MERRTRSEGELKERTGGGRTDRKFKRKVDGLWTCVKYT